MLRYFIIPAVLFFMLISSGVVFKTSYSAANDSKVQQDKEIKAPDFTLYDVDSNQVKLSDYSGKVVILDFWATWCPPCRRGIPDLISIQSEYKDNLVVIGISLDDETTQGDIPSFMKSFGINYPIVFGTMDVVTAYGNIEAIPTSFIIDQSGNIIKSYMGLVPKNIIKNEIDSLLGET
ncbi:TlpA family protein disulfide reductase [bacterium BMS3Abin03]|jgi:cytochrome c biogenesis protein CcmG/thiol:disulfide interchange protein DsbE|nr:TlpA family protein disulfide reductase [bacterium BMS3Abin03]MCG6960237.1 TlpA family protein disulfide reductase [bacterium BMS3Abin03]